MSAGAVVARILTQYSDKGSKQAQKDIAKLGRKIDDFGKKAAKSFALAVTATAALSIKIGTEAVQAAIDDAKSQAVLANALRATGNASGELTAQSEAYIEATMFRVNVADEQLRASLAQLILSTGDLTQAERLQRIALDVSAASGRDLAATTIAITRANEGTVTALKRLSPELSGLIDQGMKAEEVFILLEAAYGGTAESLANLDPLTKLKLQYGEVLETLGTELLPVVKEFAAIIETDVLPAVEAWITANGDELREGIREIVELGLGLIKTLGDLAKFYNKYDWLIKLAFSMFALGRAFKLIGKVAGPISAIFKGLEKGTTSVSEVIGKLFLRLTSVSKTNKAYAGFYTILSRIFKIIGNISGGLLLLGTAGITASNTLKDLFNIDNWPWEKDVAKIGKAVSKVTGPAKPGEGPFAKTIKEANDAAAKVKLLADARAKAAKEAAAAAAKEAVDAAKQKRIDDSILRIKQQLKISKDSALDKQTDIIQLAAAEALLKKQGVIAKEEMAKLDRLKEENFLLDAREVLAKRYLDIQKVLADQKLETKEIEELSKKWGISSAAVISYIHLVKSVEDQVISTEEIKTLASLWNTSEYEAQKFLETYMRIQDGLLDSNEVFDLIKKGFFETEKEARIYADIVATVHDGIANDADFQRVADKWDLTKAQVNAYLKAMGADFDYNGTFIDPVTLLETQWQKAAKALQDYLDKLNSAKTFDYNKLGPSGTPTVPPVVVVPKAGDPALGGSKTDSAAVAAAEAASRAAAAAYALAKSKGNMDAAAIAAAGVNPSALASQESGAIGAASIAAQLRAAETAQAIQDNITKLSRFRAKEAEDLAASLAASSQLDYDERSKFRSMTMANASSIAGNQNSGGGNTNVVVNVQGNVTTQQDLVQSIRNGLLAGQYNGQTLTLEAI
jgi:hypothetical protein